MNIVSLFRLSSTLGALWKANVRFEINIYEGHENKHKCENTIFFQQVFGFET